MRGARRGRGLRSLATALAVGVLLNGCGGSTGADEGATGNASGGAAAGLPVALPEAGVDEDGLASGGAQRPPVHWAGTLSVQPLPASDGTHYLVLQHLHGEQSRAAAMTPEQLLRTEFLAAQSAECSGTARLGGESSHCLVQAEVYGGSSGPMALAEVQLVPAALGTSALLISVDEYGPPEIALPAGAAIGLRTVDGPTPGEVTAASLEDAVVGVVTLAEPAGRPLPEERRSRCEVLDRGLHAVCEVDGAGAGADGFWYATEQPGLLRRPGDGTTYLFSRLPS